MSRKRGSRADAAAREKFLVSGSRKNYTGDMGEKSVKVSVVIPYFNRKELLVKNLLSLNLQKSMRGEFETIVVNDGSDDLEEAELNR
jgi:hypothetical protein